MRSRPKSALGGLAIAACLAAGCVPPAQSGTVHYELSSRDVGVEWHLHGKGGELICALPCDADVGERSGSYLVVHDPKKAWREDMPNELPAPAGSRVVMQPRVGKGHPALGVVGTGLGVTGAVAVFVGVVLLAVAIVSIDVNCGATPGSCGSTPLDLGVPGGILIGSGLLAGVSGVYLMENNKPAGVTLRVLPNGLRATF